MNKVNKEAKNYFESITWTKRTHDESPSIYVACLAAYNNGKLHGRWIDCTLGTDHVWNEIKSILKSSPENTKHYPCEEWAIHDFEYFPDGTISEYSGVDQVCAMAELLESEEGELILEIKSHLGINTIDEAKDYHEEHYRGEWDSLEDYVENYLEETGQLNEIPENLRYYFDYKSFARDLRFDLITIELNGKTHIWDNY